MNRTRTIAACLVVGLSLGGRISAEHSQGTDQAAAERRAQAIKELLRQATDGAGLARTIRDMLNSDTCMRMMPRAVPMTEVSSYPLPALVNEARTYRLLFYSLTNANVPGSGPVEPRPPRFVGRFDEMAADKATCEPYVPPAGIEAKDSLGRRWSADVNQMTMSEFEQQRTALFGAVAKAADAYFLRSTDANARVAAQDFLDRFQKMSEPGLRPYYRSLSPDFWQWIRDCTGKTF